MLWLHISHFQRTMNANPVGKTLVCGGSFSFLSLACLGPVCCSLVICHLSFPMSFNKMKDPPPPLDSSGRLRGSLSRVRFPLSLLPPKINYEGKENLIASIKYFYGKVIAAAYANKYSKGSAKEVLKDWVGCGL